MRANFASEARFVFYRPNSFFTCINARRFCCEYCVRGFAARLLLIPCSMQSCCIFCAFILKDPTEISGSSRCNCCAKKCKSIELRCSTYCSKNLLQHNTSSSKVHRCGDRRKMGKHYEPVENREYGPGNIRRNPAGRTA